MDSRMNDEFDVLDEYRATVGNIHASEQLKRKVADMACKKRVISAGAGMSWAFAAATVVVLCLCFRSQIMAFAQSVSYKCAYIIGGKNNSKEFSGDMGYVHVNSLKWDDFQHKYSSIDELEELIGIKLLKSDSAYTGAFPNIELQRYEEYRDYNNIVTYQIYDDSYYMYSMELEQDEEGSRIWHSLADNAYRISYTATIHNDPNLQQDETWQSSTFSGGVYVEEYVTLGDYTAYIYSFDNEYNAVIFDHNVRYVFTADELGVIGTLDVFKDFLDTLK